MQWLLFVGSSYRMGLSLVKTTSLASPSNRGPLKLTQQQSKKPSDPAGLSVFRRGYDGLGGHTKFLAPLRPVKIASRKVAKPNGISKFIKHTKCSRATDPPLPAMNLDSTWGTEKKWINVNHYCCLIMRCLVLWQKLWVKLFVSLQIRVCKVWLL